MDLETDAIVFRPNKKRKIYRRRAEDEDEEAAPPTTTTSPPAQSLDELIASSAKYAEEEGTPLSMAEILRLRKSRKPKAGVEFKATGNLARDDEGALVMPAEVMGRTEAAGPVKRFAPQTGAVADVNKHM